VDPDNRRAVDHQRLAALLDEIADEEWEVVRERADEGAPKLWLVHRLLQHRRARPDRYAGGYRPLEARGDKARHAVAFARDELVVVVPRLVVGLGAGWGDTELPLPSGRWRDVLTERESTGAVPLDDLLGSVPVAVLEQGSQP
jgi:(1->4)-alpha-D-glucan 1-alpha-D-glucosylmutase